MIKKKDILVLCLSFHTQKELQFASFFVGVSCLQVRASYYSEFCIQILIKISIAVILLLDNSEVIEILIITTFHIYLRQLWW